MTSTEIICLIIFIILAYLLGSIPFALVIGKVFFKVDVREHGSKNLGGTNAGRVLGKKIGLIVIVFDTLKCTLTIFLVQLIMRLLNSNVEIIAIMIYISGFAVVLGHCYPIFAKFKGGKAVSVTGGFFLATNWLLTIIALSLFLIITIISKYVSLGSVLGVILSCFVTFIPFVQKFMHWGLNYHFIYSIAVIIMALIIIYRHRANIKRLLNGTENKSYLFKKKNKPE